MSKDLKLEYRAKRLSEELRKSSGKVLHIFNRKRFLEEIGQAFKENTELVITVRKKRRTRTIPQLRYYWGVYVKKIVLVFREYNPEKVITPEIVHEYLKGEFLPVVLQDDEQRREIVDPYGEIVKLPYSTTILSTSEFNYYLDLISSHFAEFGIIFESPDDLWPSSDGIDIDKGAQNVTI
jgi:hypothetical protein